MLSPCPTIWKMQPLEAQAFIRDEMAQIFPPANYRDRTRDAQPRTHVPVEADLLSVLGLAGDGSAPVDAAPRDLDVQIKVAGFGGQGVLMLGEVLAEAGLDAGYEVSWLPSYGPEMRSGTSNCHVRISREPIDSPVVTRPTVLIAMNEPSLRKFIPTVEPGGIVLYNGPTVPEDCRRGDLRIVAAPFTEMADAIGASKVANIAMLGALLEITAMLDQERVAGALRRLVKNQKFYEMDLAALERGRDAVRSDENYLWGV